MVRSITLTPCTPCAPCMCSRVGTSAGSTCTGMVSTVALSPATPRVGGSSGFYTAAADSSTGTCTGMVSGVTLSPCAPRAPGMGNNTKACRTSVVCGIQIRPGMVYVFNTVTLATVAGVLCRAALPPYRPLVVLSVNKRA